jgi:hypothetical protein
MAVGMLSHITTLVVSKQLIKLVSERSPAPLRHTTKKVRTISELLIMEQDSICRQPGLTVRVYDSVYHQPNIRMSSFLAAHTPKRQLT